MRLEKYITEKYHTAFNIDGKYIEIFVNPTSKDIRDIKSDEIRFIAISNIKKVYVWNADKLIHLRMWERLDFKGSPYGDRNVCMGVIGKKESKWKMIYSDSEKRYWDKKEERYKEFKWLEKYFNISDWYLGKGNQNEIY
uniref:Uncharacterized protein n=1 Tax=viral metagenome TaxID=1070528 RepID=A0A6M3JMI6_9ZZZZ